MVSNRSLCRLELSSFATRSCAFKTIERLALGGVCYTPKRIPVFSLTTEALVVMSCCSWSIRVAGGDYGVASLTFAWCFWNAVSILSNCTLSMSPVLSPVHDQASISVPL